MSPAAIRRAKGAALIALAALSFASPLAEMLATGRVETFSGYGVADTVLSLVLLFCWYHLGKEQHDYRAGKLMNAGVLVLAVAALPVYFIRSRGWKRGTRALSVALLFLAATLALGEMGERLGAFLIRASGAA